MNGFENGYKCAMEDVEHAMSSMQMKESRLKAQLTQAQAAKMCHLTERSWGVYERRGSFPEYIKELFAVKIWLKK